MLNIVLYKYNRCYNMGHGLSRPDFLLQGCGKGLLEDLTSAQCLPRPGDPQLENGDRRVP